ncbi:MAG TPA: hypothetical protein VEQ41_01605 [Solirubrobacterales bacterium]|nr:hypothetical protein [Solirubrobacterales bacterium]
MSPRHAFRAALAISAVLASPAQADYAYTAEEAALARLHAADSTFERDTLTTGGTGTCAATTWETVLTALPASHLSVTVFQTGCKVFGLPATMRTNGCTYTLGTPVAVESHFRAPVDLVCPGPAMELTIWGSAHAHSTGLTPICNITFEPSTDLVGAITMRNTSDGAIAIEASTVEDIPTVLHRKSFLCPGVDTETRSDFLRHLAPKTMEGFDEAGVPVPIHIG